MSIRYIIRPKHIWSTPNTLKRAFNAVRLLPYGRDTRYGRRAPDWHRDFFLVYPPADMVTNADDTYRSIRAFCGGNKRDQRLHLSFQGIRVPATPSSDMANTYSPSTADPKRYVVRPHRHSKGEGWRITEDPEDFNPATEYIQELYPKTHEYRILFVLGTPLITLYKRAEGIPQDQPWNHAQGASFVTVNDYENNRLRHFDVYDRLKELDVIKSAHIVAADVLYASKKNGYAVTELNFCPSITIPDNIERVKDHVLQVRSRAG
jgi:hypothetical protein